MRARQAQLVDLSAMALLKRLRKSRDWLYALCVELFHEHGIEVSTNKAFQVCAFDATVVREPGRTGSTWWLHYSVTLSSLGCDFYKLAGTKGAGMGESFKQFPVHAGDYILADRGYATGAGIRYAAQARGYVTARMNTGALNFETASGRPFALLASVERLHQAGDIGVWKAAVKAEALVVGLRLCAA